MSAGSSIPHIKPHTHIPSEDTEQPQRVGESSIIPGGQTDSSTHTRTPTTQRQEHDTALTQAWIWKTRKAQNLLGGERHQDRDGINHYTNILAGPPAYLTTQQKERWKAAIEEAKEACRKDILIPALEGKITYWQARRLTTTPTDAEKLEHVDKILDSVWTIWSKKGFSNKEITKIITQADLNADFIPTAPPLPPLNTMQDNGQDSTALQTNIPTTGTAAALKQDPHPHAHLGSQKDQTTQTPRANQTITQIQHTPIKHVTPTPEPLRTESTPPPHTRALQANPTYATTKNALRSKTQTQPRLSVPEAGGSTATLKAPTQLKLAIHRDGKIAKTTLRGTTQEAQYSSTTSTREQAQNDPRIIKPQSMTNARKSIIPSTTAQTRIAFRGTPKTQHGARDIIQPPPPRTDTSSNMQKQLCTNQQEEGELVTAQARSTSAYTETNQLGTQTEQEEQTHRNKGEIKANSRIEDSGTAAETHRTNIGDQKTESKITTVHQPRIRIEVDNSPGDHPTPIAIGTPKAHYAIHGRTPTGRTPLGPSASRQDMILTPTTKEAIMQIDLTMDITPDKCTTPKTRGAKKSEEDTSKPRTPDKHTHTPEVYAKLREASPRTVDKQPIPDPRKTPTRVQSPVSIGGKDTHTGAGTPGNSQQTQRERHNTEKRAPDQTVPSDRQAPRTLEAQGGLTSTEVPPPGQNGMTHMNQTDAIQTHLYIDVDIPTPLPPRRRRIWPMNSPGKGEQAKDTPNIQADTANAPSQHPSLEKGRPPLEHDEGFGHTQNHTEGVASLEPAQNAYYDIMEEDWQQLCRETFEDIELQPRQPESPKLGSGPCAQTQPPTKSPQNTNQGILRQQGVDTTEAIASKRDTDVGDYEKDETNTQGGTTNTNTTRGDSHTQHSTVQTSHTDSPQRQAKGIANHHHTQQGGTFYQAIERIIRQKIHRTTQEDNAHRHIVKAVQIYRHTPQQPDRETKERRLKNRRRKLRREQKYIREGRKPKKRNKAADTEAQNTVYDYTTKGLTQAEKQVLGLGKTFIITQNDIDIDRIKTDIATFIRRLRLHYIFRERRKDETQRNLDYNRTHKNVHKGQTTQKGLRTQWRKPKSTFQPEETQRDITRIEQNIEINIATQLTNMKKGPPNTPREWMTAIDTLKHRIADKEITITQADKGGGIIVLDYDTYTSKGTKYIEEEAEAYEVDYTPEELLIAKLTKEREKVTKKLKDLDIIPTDTATYATHQTIEKITGMKFYYKIHKTRDIHSMPVRPLQSCIGSPTQHISQVLTDIYEPYINSEYIPTYIRDTNHTLYELDGTRLRETDTLATADVVALYPSIDHEKGLNAIKEFTKEYMHKEDSKAEALTNAFRLVITQNYVKWQGNIYKQTRGVAMGTPVAVTYANIYMNAIDHKIANACTYIKLHRRFIDDNLYIIPIDKKEEFRHALNTIDPPALRHTVAYLGETPHDTALPFLDIKFYLNAERELYTRLYTKDTDKHQYLMPYSQHPKHIIRNIPRGVFARIRRLCKDQQAYLEDSSLAVGWLKDRGYKESIINQIREDTGKKDRWQMIRIIEERARKVGNKSEDPTLIPFINTYSTPTKGFSQTIHSQKEALDSIFKKAKVKTLNAYRRKQNLGDILMQPSLRIHIEGANTPPKIFTKCGKHPHKKPCPCTGLHNPTQCRVCAHIDQENIGVKTRINRPITCDSKNVIYMIWCDACGSRYIGETQQKIRDRFTQHLYNLDIQEQVFYNHFKKPGHGAVHMRLAIIETLHTEEPLYRKIKESTWIRKLKTYTPHGLNDKMKESPLDTIKTQGSQQERVSHTPQNKDSSHTHQDQGNDNTKIGTPSKDVNRPTIGYTAPLRLGRNQPLDTAIPRVAPRHGTQQHTNVTTLANFRKTSIPSIQQRHKHATPLTHRDVYTSKIHPPADISTNRQPPQLPHPEGSDNRVHSQQRSGECQRESRTPKITLNTLELRDAPRTQPCSERDMTPPRTTPGREGPMPHSQP